jgi:exportin-2 (importin alpha re-exporter)
MSSRYSASHIWRFSRCGFLPSLLLTQKQALLKHCHLASLPSQRTDELLSSPTALPSPADPKTLSKTLLLLLQVFYDLNSQDLPEFFEDNVEPIMALLHKYLTWTRPELTTPDDDDEEEAGPLEKIRASICEIAELYTQRYLDAFPMIDKFVETTWTLVTGLGSSVKYDIVSLKSSNLGKRACLGKTAD